ncbi:MAG: hypothetical protein LBS26_01940 [Campylobacteraceae bacterium]|nr:hypothetical protein [Campylobacteraceae bacterium]
MDRNGKIETVFAPNKSINYFYDNANEVYYDKTKEAFNLIQRVKKMARTLIIEIWDSGDWNIEDNNLSAENKLNTKAPLGIFREDKGKITYLYDYGIDEKCIKIAKEEGGAYLERCVFKHEQHTFEGDFIDAFLYIYNKLKAYHEAEQKGYTNGKAKAG